MVYKLKPLELSFDFEDREYELGDTIDIRVDMKPNGDVNVREGRVDLLCEERFTRAERGIVMGAGGAQATQGGSTRITTDYVPASSWQSQREERYVHSTAVFLNDTSLPSGRPSSQTVRLQMGRALPRHFKEAQDLLRDADSSWTFKWRLVASVNIVRGRDPKRQRTVKVKLPAISVVPRGGVKPKMTRPKPATGPSEVRRRAR